MLPQAENFHSRYQEWRSEAYDFGSRYEAKGKLGRFVMRLTHRGEKRRKLEAGRGIYSMVHYREAVVEAYNKELMATWSD